MELDDATVMALCGMEVEKLYKHFGNGQAEQVGTVWKIKLADRGLNLERLGRHLKLFTEKVEVTPAGIGEGTDKTWGVARTSKLPQESCGSMAQGSVRQSGR